MNDKEDKLALVLSIVVEECTCSINDEVTVTAEDVKGRCMRDNVKMTRCIYVAQLKNNGYSNATIAAVIGRRPKAVPEILAAAYDYKKKSRIFRLTDARCTLRIDPIFAE